MTREKMKAVLFTVVFVLPLAFLYKFFFPDTSKMTGFFLILFLLIIFHSIGNWLFSRSKRVNKK